VRGGGRQARLTGQWGERMVGEDMVRKGWIILEVNFRCRLGEIDIIARRGGFLSFTEVKLRKSDRFAPARAFVTAEKQRKLRLAAEYYLMKHPTDLQPRFDVVEIYAPQGRDTRHPEIVYIENAF